MSTVALTSHLQVTLVHLQNPMEVHIPAAFITYTLRDIRIAQPMLGVFGCTVLDHTVIPYPTILECTCVIFQIQMDKHRG